MSLYLKIEVRSHQKFLIKIHHLKVSGMFFFSHLDIFLFFIIPYNFVKVSILKLFTVQMTRIFWMSLSVGMKDVCHCMSRLLCHQFSLHTWFSAIIMCVTIQTGTITVVWQVCPLHTSAGGKLQISQNDETKVSLCNEKRAHLTGKG